MELPPLRRLILLSLATWALGAITKDAARCKGGPGEAEVIKNGTGVIGTLDCDHAFNYQQSAPGKWGKCANELRGGYYYSMSGEGRGICESIGAVRAIAGTTAAVYNCKLAGDPGSRWTKHPNMAAEKARCQLIALSKAQTGLLTKAQMTHPDLATNGVVAIGLKRIAPCIRTESGQNCTHVFKKAICIDCRSMPNPCEWDQKDGRDLWANVGSEGRKGVNGKNSGKGAKSWGCTSDKWFRNVQMSMVQPSELWNVYYNCVRKVFEKMGNSLLVPKEFECLSHEKSPDQQKFTEWLKSF